MDDKEYYTFTFYEIALTVRKGAKHILLLEYFGMGGGGIDNINVRDVHGGRI